MTAGMGRARYLPSVELGEQLEERGEPHPPPAGDPPSNVMPFQGMIPGTAGDVQPKAYANPKGEG